MIMYNSDVSLLCLPAGEGSCDGAAITVHATVVVAEQSDCSVVVESTRRASWIWRGTEVPVMGELEDWKGEVLRKEVIMCLVKLNRGEIVNICGSEENLINVVWFVHFLEWEVVKE